MGVQRQIWANGCMSTVAVCQNNPSLPATQDLALFVAESGDRVNMFSIRDTTYIPMRKDFLYLVAVIEILVYNYD